MPYPQPFPVHDFPNSAHCAMLRDPENLRELMRVMAPRSEGSFDFPARNLLTPAFTLADWHSREGDLLIELPFRATPDAAWRAAVLSLEHWSRPQRPMPLRALIYVALHREGELKAWEALADERMDQAPEQRAPLPPTLRLDLVWPIAYCTGPHRWTLPRDLEALIETPKGWPGPKTVWEPTVWELAAFTPAQLLAVPGGFPAVLAVVRALDRPVARDPGLLERIFREACGRIFALPGAQRIRRCDLLWFTLSYVGYRRGEAEERKMMAVAEALAPRYSVQDDVREVCESVELTWFETMRRKGLEEGLQQGRTEGLQQGRTEGLQQGLEQGELRMLRQLLLTCITTRFGTVSADLEAGITAEADSSRLHRAYLQALTAATLDDVVL